MIVNSKYGNSFLLRKIMIVFSLVSFGISSCTSDGHMKNNIVPGRFRGYRRWNNEEQSDIYCEFKITPISEEEYENAKGINVIKDVVKEGFYSLELTIHEQTNTYSCNFVNLRDPYDGKRKAMPVRYVDDNDNFLYPYTHVSNSKEEARYEISNTYSFIVSYF